MDFRLYNGFLDPVFIITDDAFIQFANPAAVRWLSLAPGEELRGKRLEEFVVFHESSLLNSLPEVKAWSITPYSQTYFDLPKHGYQNIAKLTAQSIPIKP